MSEPTFDPDDPRLTAYALDECDAAERRAVEQLLAASPDAASEVERTRTLARALAVEYDRERETYLMRHPDSAFAASVVPFPGMPHRWRKGIALSWRIAAVLVLFGSLIYLLEKPTKMPSAGSLAQSGPSAQPTPLPNSQPVQLPRKSAVIEDNAPSGPPATAASPSEPMIVAKTASPDMSANASGGASAATAPGDADAERIAETFDDLALAKPVESRNNSFAARREQNRSMPAPASAPGAVRRDAQAKWAEHSIAGSVVRMRTADGAFSGGVILTRDGSILSDRPLTDDGGRKQCTVQLGDGHELTATIQRLPAGLCRLQVNATGLSPVAFATKIPAVGTQIRVAFVNRQTGAVQYASGRVSDSTSSAGQAEVRLDEPLRSDLDASFAFDPAGDLLALVLPLSSRRAKEKDTAAFDQSVRANPTLRVFTAAERAALLQPTGKARH